MTNIDKIVKTIHSCKTKDHINTCINWIHNLEKNTVIENKEHSILIMMCLIKSLRMQYE